MSKEKKARSKHGRWRFCSVSIVAGHLVSCGAEVDEVGAGDVDTTAPGRAPVSWARFRDSAYREPWEGGMYLVDGDVPLSSMKELREYYDSWVDAEGALTVAQVFAGDNVWSFPDTFRLTYCISDSFDDAGRKDEVVDAMAKATASWHDLLAVRFAHIASEDENCDQSNSNVLFDVRPVPTDGVYASSFFPDDIRADRSVRIRPVAFTTTSGGRDFEGILRHELGHTLGFRHEHIWLTNPCTGEGSSDARLVTPYDVDSVMHYPQCRPSGTGGYRQSQEDYTGSISLYGLAPALIGAIGG